MKTEMRRDTNGLWVPSSFYFNRHHAAPIVRTIELPAHIARAVNRKPGTRVKVTQCDARTTFHIESNEGIDAVVRPKTVRYKLRSMT